MDLKEIRIKVSVCLFSCLFSRISVMYSGSFLAIFIVKNQSISQGLNLCQRDYWIRNHWLKLLDEETIYRSFLLKYDTIAGFISPGISE